MKKIIICILLVFITIQGKSQFRIETNGEGRLWTNNMGPYDNSFISYSNHDYSKSYVVDRLGKHNFFVFGNGFAVSRGYYTMSDKRLKTDIQDVNKSANLFMLQAKSYKLNDASKIDTNASINSSKQFENPTQYGFIAQEVKILFPEIVLEDENGFLAVNYTQFIPLIIETLKEENAKLIALEATVNKQKNELDNLKKEYKNCCENIQNKPNLNDVATLYDNTPNPFKDQTKIEFYIPKNATTAQLLIHDMQGKEIKSFNINQFEKSYIVINGSELIAGMYFYTLLVDNKLIDSKKMILTNK